MSNYPEENPNTYLGLEDAAGHPTRVTATGPDIELDLVGKSQTELAELLNLKFSGMKLYCRTDLDIGLASKIFSESGVAQGFALENITEGWHPDMISDFERLTAEFLAQEAMGVAHALKHAHENMIPF